MKKTVVWLLTAMLLVGALSGCSSGGNVIKVASVSPLSGSQAAMGEAIKNGAQMALEERAEEFKALGFTLQLAPQDDQADPKVGVSVARKMILEEDILAVVGHLNSGVAIPSSEVYAEKNLAMVSPANTAVDVTERGLKNVTRICARDDGQGPAGAEYMFNEAGAKSVFVINDKTTYGQGVADEFSKHFAEIGGQVLGNEGITPGESDFSAVEEKVRASSAEAVYFGGMYPEGALLIKQLAQKGITVKFMGPDGLDSAELANIAGDAVVGALYTSTAADASGTPEGAAFVAKYEGKFNKKPEGYAFYGYDAMNVALNGIKNAIAANGGKKPSRDQVTDAIATTSGFVGIATTVTYNEKGDNLEGVIYVSRFDANAYPATMVKAVPAGDFLK